MKRGRRDSLVYGTVLLTFSGLFGQVLGFFYRIAVSRLIGSELMGLYQLIMPVYSVLMSVTAAGLTMAVSTLSARYAAQGDKGAVRQVRRACLGLFFLSLIPWGILTLALSDPISVYLLGDARTRLGLILLLPCILLTGIENLQKHSFFGLGLVKQPAFAEMAEQVVRAAAVLGLLVLFLPQSPERTVGLIVLGMVLCEVFSAATQTVLFRRYIGVRPRGNLEPRALRREIVSIAVPVGGTALLGNLMGSANAILIPQRLVAGGATVGEAMSAFGIINGMTIPMLLLPSAFIAAMGLVLVPQLAETAAMGKWEETRAQVGRSVGATSALMLPAMALLTVIGPTLGGLLFREPRVGEYIAPLAAGVLLSCYQAVFASALNGLGKQRAAARNMLLSDGVQLLFTFFLVGDPRIGLGGYVAGLLASAMVGAALNWNDLRRAARMRAQVFSWAVAPALGAVLAGLCSRLLFHRLLDVGVGPWTACLATAAFGIVLYCAALQAQGVRWASLFRGSAGQKAQE